MQNGSMLLEALIGILIFSLGVLAIVGMQTTAVLNSSESKYRSDANLLANQYIGQMWLSDRIPANMKANFEGGVVSDGAQYTPWQSILQNTLPNGDSTVVFDAALDGTVIVTVTWQAPGSVVHRHAVVAQIR